MASMKGSVVTRLEDTDDKTIWSKIPKTTDCRPRSRDDASIRSKPMNLANDLLASAYRVRRRWNGEKDLAEESRREQREEMENAPSWTAWKRAADRLDILEGNFLYKLDEHSDECDMTLIRKRLDKLKQANHDDDVDEMLLQIRHALKRDLGGMCNPHLYQHTNIGTKHIIEEYTEVVKYTIDRVIRHCENADANEIDRCGELLKAARQSFGNTALMLSGGGTLGMCHVGVVKALMEVKVLPKVVCGSSAGSIVGSVLCTQRSDVLESKLDALCSGDLRVFQGVDEWQGIPGMAINLLKGDPAFNISNLCRVMKGLLGDITFREAFNYTGMVLNIHVSCRDKHNLPRLLNYVTTPNVVIWSAVASSCALPSVFEAPGLKAKNPRTNEIEHWGHSDHRWIDGSIEGDLPAQILERLFNVNNFIASQVNPHVTQFLAKEGEVPTLIRKSMSVTRSNAIYMLDSIMEQGWDPFPVKMIRAVLSQKYEGDVTILPNVGWVPVNKILANPTHEFMLQATREGEKATWPKLDRIHKSVAIELALGDGVYKIKSMGISKHRRVPSATRSEHGLSHLRSRSSGTLKYSGKVDFRFNRGRSAAHRTAKSMTQPTFVMPGLAVPGISMDNFLSSSDDTRSGGSSPATEYDDHPCRTDNEPSENESNADDDRLHMLAFLSQPASPSLSKHSFWGGEPQRQISPLLVQNNISMRRALKGLHMSSIDSTVNNTPDPH